MTRHRPSGNRRRAGGELRPRPQCPPGGHAPRRSSRCSRPPRSGHAHPGRGFPRLRPTPAPPPPAAPLPLRKCPRTRKRVSGAPGPRVRAVPGISRAPRLRPTPSFSPGPESLPTSQTRSRAAGPGRPETRDARSSAAGFESHPFPDPRPSRSDLPACGLFTGSRPDPRCVRSPLATCALALCASRSRPGLRALPRLRESADPRLLQKRPGPAAGSPPRSPPQ